MKDFGTNFLPVTRSMTTEMKIQWKELQLADQELIGRYYAKVPVRNCEFTFANNYLWKPFYPIFFGIIEGNLVFESGEAGMSVSFPQGDADLKKTVDALTGWFEQVGRPFKMHLVSPAQFARLEEAYPGRFQIEYDRDFADYVYEREKLKNLPGKSFHGKKNHCNKFRKLYPDWRYETITPENVAECRAMAQEWWERNDFGEGGEKEEEIAVTMSALDNMELLGLRGGMLYAGGRVVAFAIGEPCGPNMFVVHFEKAFADVEGAYSMINQQFVEHEMDGYTYVNREDDAGSEGLRKAKLSYHPAFLMEKGLVTEKHPAKNTDGTEKGCPNEDCGGKTERAENLSGEKTAIKAGIRERTMEALELTKEMLGFIEESPTAFHAAANAEQLLKEDGFERLDFPAVKKLVSGGKYYTMQNGSAVIAVKIPQAEAAGFRIVASHSDSPCFKVKETPEMKLEGRYVKLNTEKYGGMILNTWLDRPLSVAGRVFVKDQQSGMPVQRLVNIKKDMLIIPNVAIHFNREINDGFKLNPQVDMLPLFAQDQELTLNKLCAQQLGIAEEEILGSDLYVYNRDKGRIMGADDAFIGSPRLDDLQCAFATLKGFLAASPRQYISVYALFDNEEVGSGTKQGADSTLLADVLDAVLDGILHGNAADDAGGCADRTAEPETGCKQAEEGRTAVSPLQKRAFLQNSFLLSADNGHAVHPNHPEKSDPTNRPFINGGVVLKFQGSQRYTTDGFSAALVRDICKAHEIPVQNFANRADIAGGSTLGNISTAHVSVPSADIGLAQLAMHSAFETGGVEDTKAMAELVRWFMV